MAERFELTERSFNVRQFIDRFHKHLPKIAVVREGFMGVHEDLHQFGLDEVYWVFDVGHQERLLFSDQRDQYISIARDYETHLHVKHPGSDLGPKLTLKEFLKEWKGYPDQAQFCQREVVEYCMEDEEKPEMADVDGDEDHLGFLEFEGCHHQKYLLAYPISAGEHGFDQVDPDLRLIPAYLPIELCVAVGFTTKPLQDFTRFCQSVTHLTAQFDQTTPQYHKGVLVLSQRPDNEYEYVDTETLLKPALQPREGKDEDSEDYLDPVPYSRTYENHQLPPREPKRKEAKSESNVKPEPPPLRYENVKPTGKVKPQVRPAEAVPKVAKKAEDDSSIPRSRGESEDSRQNSPEKPAPTSTSSEDDSAFLTGGAADDEPDVADQKDGAKSKRVSLVKQLSMKFESQGLSANMVKSGPLPRVKKQPSRAEFADSSTVKDIGDVPTDVSELTIREVQDCMRMLGLSKCAECVARHQVDGRLLKSLNGETIMETFKLNSIEAQKLRMFVHEGWRPNDGLK